MLVVAVRQLIPEGLAEIPPGPELSRVLAGLELSRLSGFDCVEVLKARYRQLNHEKARLMATIVEVGLCDIGPDDELPRQTVPDEFAADEVRAALVLTRRAADAQFDLAYDLLTRLPAVHVAMNAGVLDEPRARVFSDWTAELSVEQARALCTELLPGAPGLTTGQLVEQIKKWAIAIDPDWARRRYEQAVADRKVIGYRNPDGSANLCGLNLPINRVAAASGHIDSLAKSAKRAGDARPIDHIRADLFLGMTDGTYTGLDDAHIVGLLITQSKKTAAVPDDNAGDLGNDHSDDDESPASSDGDNGGNGPEYGEPSDDKHGGHRQHDDQRELAPSPTAAGVELRVRLSTLLGHDQYPAELTGWGPLHADLARGLTATMTRAQWRYAITDPDGQLLCCGITRTRPLGTPACAGTSGGSLELQVPTTTLRDLPTDQARLAGWAPVVADLARQLDHHATRPDPYVADADRRVPGVALRRWVETRDQFCTFVGCRAPARAADKDHTRDHAHGGLTTGANLGPACRHDHRLKHEGGWRLDQLQPGVFRWTSRLGHHYERRPPLIIEPLPDPIPRHQPLYDVLEPDK